MVNELEKIVAVNFIFQMKNPFWNISKSLSTLSIHFPEETKPMLWIANGITVHYNTLFWQKLNEEREKSEFP